MANVYDNDKSKDGFYRDEEGSATAKQLEAQENGTHTDDTQSINSAEKDEQGALTNSTASTGNKAEQQGEPDTPFSYKGGNKGAIAKAKSFFSRHKKGVILGGAGAGILLPLLFVLLFISGLFEIPHFVENVAAWQFAKVTNQYRQSINSVMDEKMSYDALDDADKTNFDTEYGKTSMLGMMKDTLSPNTFLDNLEGSGLIKYNYKNSVLFGKQLTSVTIDPNVEGTEPVTVNVNSKFNKLLHPVQTLDQYNTIMNTFDDAMKAYDPTIPVVVRGAATIQLLRNMGASLKGIAAAKYAGDDERDASIQLDEETYDAVNNVTTDPELISSDPALASAAEDAVSAEESVVENPAELGQLIDDTSNTSGIPTQVDTALDQSLNPGSATQSLLSKAAALPSKTLDAINPIYTLAVPVCTFYEGAVITPQSVNSQEQSTIREYSLVASTADQQKDGTSFTAEADGAMSDKLGDIQDSVAMERADGQTVNTLDTTGGQRSAFGTFGGDIFNALFGPNNPISAIIGSSAATACPIVTNAIFGGALGVANIAQIIASFGAGPEATAGDVATEAGVIASAKLAVERFATNIFERIGDAGILGTIKGVTSVGVQGGAQYALSYYAGELAKLTVEARGGMLNSGLESGTNFANNVDDGANQLSNEIVRTEYYGRPLTSVEIAQEHDADQNDIAYNNESSSAYNRYLSMSNPESLVSRVATTTASLFSRTTFTAVLNNLSDLFSPVGIGSKLFTTIDHSSALADSSQDTQDYGNVQFGYSNQEQQLMQEQSYAPIENEYALDQSGQENQIAATYGQCFTESMGTMLETVNSTTGTTDIVRDPNTGNINESQGLCSPQNLGPNNPTYGDLVFRWRLLNDYQNTANNLVEVQNATGSSS